MTTTQNAEAPTAGTVAAVDRKAIQKPKFQYHAVVKITHGMKLADPIVCVVPADKKSELFNHIAEVEAKTKAEGGTVELVSIIKGRRIEFKAQTQYRLV